MAKIVSFSGGVGSWLAAKRARPDLLIFADTKMEDEDLYRFLPEAAANVGAELVTLADGRTPWEVFHDVRLIGNTRADPCSRILKRDLIRKWLEDNCDPADTTVYLGIDWTEVHRRDGAIARWAPWKVEFPLCNRPFFYKAEILDLLRAEGIEPPRLYKMGFPHNNCGGFCIKAGQGEFARLFWAMPERYREHEAKEEEMRAYLGKDVSILRDRTGGQTRPLPLIELRRRIETGQSLDMDDGGGCGCGV
jgi:hypothetical protein